MFQGSGNHNYIFCAANNPFCGIRCFNRFLNQEIARGQLVMRINNILEILHALTTSTRYSSGQTSIIVF